MANSKGVKDNKCLEDIDLGEITKKIDELSKNIENFVPTKISSEAFVTSPVDISFNYTSDYGSNISQAVNKNGYYPIACEITSIDFSYVDSGFDKGFGIDWIGISSRAAGSCTINGHLAGIAGHTQQGTIHLAVTWVRI